MIQCIKQSQCLKSNFIDIYCQNWEGRDAVRCCRQCFMKYCCFCHTVLYYCGPDEEGELQVLARVDDGVVALVRHCHTHHITHIVVVDSTDHRRGDVSIPHFELWHLSYDWSIVTHLRYDWSMIWSTWLARVIFNCQSNVGPDNQDWSRYSLPT